MASRQHKSGSARKEIEFRVIAGELKATRVVVPDLGVTRPPLTRLRKSIFDFLNPHLEGAAYLDLFCGTGSYLFEAVSRGAQTVIGVEREERLAAAINKHADLFGIADRLDCHCEDVLEAIPRLHKMEIRFDIIMMAPPQYVGLIDQTLATLARNWVVTKGGLIICQHDTSETDDFDWGGWTISQRRKYGNTTFTVLQSDH